LLYSEILAGAYNSTASTAQELTFLTVLLESDSKLAKEMAIKKSTAILPPPEHAGKVAGTGGTRMETLYCRTSRVSPGPRMHSESVRTGARVKKKRSTSLVSAF